MSKRILSALLAVLFLITGLPSTVWAVGEGNMEAGGGQTETVTGDSFWNGQWGIRFCVVDVVSQSVVSATYDASNYGGLSNYWHYGKTNKFDYRNGTTLTIRQGNYTLETPAVSIPTIVRTSGAPDIKALIICVVSTLVFAQVAALFANKAKPKTLNRITGGILVILGIAILSVNYFAK